MSSGRPMQVTVSPDYGVLIDAVNPLIAAPAARTPTDVPDWDRLVESAYWHRLGPLLFRHLGPEGPAPPEVLEALRRVYVVNATRNLYLSAALERILAAFEGVGVAAMLLKGVALIDTVYTDPALRQMGDMDLLVPKTSLDEANAALAELGYGYQAPVREIDKSEWMRVHHRHDAALVDKDGFVRVELHYHVVKGAPSAHFDLDGFWERGRPLRAGSPHVRPCPEDLLLHACIHFTYDRMTTSIAALAQLGDIAWILDRERIDWHSLIATARAYKLDDPVFLALFAAHELGLAVPAEPLGQLRPSGFNPRLGRRMIDLRVLRSDAGVPRHSMRDAIAPGREGLENSWGAAPGSAGSLSRAYIRRAVKSLPLMRRVLKEPRTVIQDYRLNRQLRPLTGGLRE